MFKQNNRFSRIDSKIEQIKGLHPSMSDCVKEPGTELCCLSKNIRINCDTKSLKFVIHNIRTNYNKT